MAVADKALFGPWGVARAAKGAVSGKPRGSFGVNVLLLGVGATLIISGVRNRPILDVVTGKDLGEVNYEDLRVGLSGETVSQVMDEAVPVTNLPPGKYPDTSMFDGKPVANWIIPELQWARKTGRWKGRVTSGMRSKSEQEAAARSFGLQHYPHGPLASNHYIGNGAKYPRGAVDVTEYMQLAEALKSYPGGAKLKWYGPGDAVHFSGTGR